MAELAESKPADVGQGQPGSSPRKPSRQPLVTHFTRSTHPGGQPLVKDTVKPRLNPNLGECLSELLPHSPKFT
jgi:hypothetical protein